MPALDDWTASTPIASFSPDLLLPDSIFWRPFQHLFRVLAFWFPYPGFVHTTNAIGHLIAIALIYILARQCGASSRNAHFGAFAYAIAPVVGTAVWAVDSENHIWSIVCGLTSVAILCGNRSRKLYSHAGWLTFAMLATLWNESGIAWFAVAPLIKAYARISGQTSGKADLGAPAPLHHRVDMKRVYRRAGAEIAMGFLGVSIYFSARFLLLGTIALGASGSRYGASLDPGAFVKHATILIGITLTTVDTLALLSPQPSFWLAITSFIMGLPLLFSIARRLAHRWTVHHWLIATSACITTVAPFSIMGHISESYAQHPAAVLAILLPVTGSSHDRKFALRRWSMVVPALALLACLIGNTHKFMSMVQLGNSSVAVGRSIAETVYPFVPERICVICEEPAGKHGYSVFEAPPNIASSCGLAARMYWGWRQDVVFYTVSSLAECPHIESSAVVLAAAGLIKYPRPDCPAVAISLSGQVQRLR